jgi:Protein of unknown function (DUF1091)
MDRVDCINAPGFLECTNVKVKRVTKQRLMFGNFTIFEPMDNNVSVQVTAFKKQGGEYRRMPYRIVKPLCNAVKEGIYLYDDMCANSTLPKDRPCPYPAGTYTFNGYTPSLANVPTAIIPSGDYRVHVSLIKGQEEFQFEATGSVIQL